MSVSFRSKRFSTLLIGLVLLLIAQVKCQGAWTRICENGQTVAWLSSNTGLMSPSGGGVSGSNTGLMSPSGGGVSGSGQCLSSSNPPRFDMIRAPTTFNFPIAGRTLLCGTNNGCPSVAPVQPWTGRICSGQSLVAYIAGPNDQIYPINGDGTPSGSARCTGTRSIPDLNIDSNPSFSLGSNPYCTMTDGTCARVG
ncbi:secreted protein [Melampsora americana]|nr:secreted protein [Melampsora americana]